MRGQNSRLEARPDESTFRAFALLLLLVCADLGFMLLHLISVETGWLREAGISLEAEGGPAEIFQYLKEFSVMVCMVLAFVATRRAVYISWVLVFTFLLADDSMQIHESVGTWLGERYSFAAPYGLRPQDVGELLFAAIIGLVMLALVGGAVWGGTKQCRRVSRDLGILIVSLGLVGILLDVVHVVAYYGRSLLAQFLLVIEDGGEMIVMSAMTAYAFHVASHRGSTRFSLWARLMRHA